MLRTFLILHSQICDLCLNFFLHVHLPGKTARGFILSASWRSCEVLGLFSGRVETYWKEELLLLVCKDNWFARVTRGGHSWKSRGAEGRGLWTQLSGGQRPGQNYFCLFWSKANLEYNGILISVLFACSIQLHQVRFCSAFPIYIRL